MLHKRKYFGVAHIGLASIALAALIGCSRGERRLPLGGEVTLDGKPLVGAIVSFRPTGPEGGASGAVTDDNGRFVISADKGLKPGTYAVVIQKWVETDRTFYDAQAGKNVAITAPIRYRDSNKLTAVVSADGANRFAFHLTSAK